MSDLALAPDPARAAVPAPPPPLAMLAELTHRCPLACPYCSNPLDLVKKAGELDTTQWAEIFQQAAELGVLQLHLSGGEPLSRPDLEPLVRAARAVDLYVNLITSGIGLTEKRLDALEAAGLDHVQLSLQGVDADGADEIGGYRGGFARKMQAARWIGARGIPLTVNAVMHRRNLDRLEATIAMAVELGARRLEVATVQFHGWASLNRGALMPTRAQAGRAAQVVREARARLKGVLAIDYVPADHHADFPKACMGGWGSTGLNVTPDGTVLPCHAAQTIPGMVFEVAPATPLGRIWRESASFRAYRGTDWMQEPCRSCDRKLKDFGGCRCQALAMTGDAAAADPVCIRSPHRAALTAAAERDAGDAGAALTYREAPR